MKLATFVMFLLSAITAAAQTAAPAVVVVCEHGAAKSVIATAYFNKLARERGLPYRATFRGTDPQAELSVSALKGLREDGIDIPDGKPKAISPTDVSGWRNPSRFRGLAASRAGQFSGSTRWSVT